MKSITRRRWPLTLLFFGLTSVVVARGFVVHEQAAPARIRRAEPLLWLDQCPDEKIMTKKHRRWSFSLPKPWLWQRRPSSSILSSSPSSCDETTAVPTDQNNKESVHLKLTTTIPDQPNIATEVNSESNVNKATNSSNTTKTVQVHTFQQPKTKNVWKALNTGRSKFQAFLAYNGITCQPEDIETFSVSMQDSEASKQIRAEWRDLWKAERLITDRTEVLAVYPSEKEGNKKVKRGGFSDHLHLYVERLMAILGC